MDDVARPGGMGSPAARPGTQSARSRGSQQPAGTAQVLEEDGILDQPRRFMKEDVKSRIVSMRRLPTGSGHGGHSEFGTFIDHLIDLIKLARLERAVGFETRSLERSRRPLIPELDNARVKLFEFQTSMVRRWDRRIRERELEDDLESCQRRFDEGEGRLQALRQDIRERKSARRQRIQQLYDLETPITNASFRPDNPKLSPIFWRRLRLGKAGAELLAEYEDQYTRSKLDHSLSQTAVRDVIVRVRRAMRTTGQGTANARSSLRESLQLLDASTRYCKKMDKKLDVAESRVEIRREKLNLEELNLLLDIAAPVLEAEKLVDRDRLRPSGVEEEKPGEPTIFDDEYEPGLTQEQRNNLLATFKASIEETDRCQAVFETLFQDYDEDSAAFLALNPERTRLEFDQEDVMYNKQATQKLIEAQINEQDLRMQVMREKMKHRQFDFNHGIDDEKHQTPRTDMQLREKAERTSKGWRSIEDWRLQSANANQLYVPPRTAAISNETSNDWTAREIEFLERRESVADAFTPQKANVCGKLLKRYQ